MCSRTSATGPTSGWTARRTARCGRWSLPGSGAGWPWRFYQHSGSAPAASVLTDVLAVLLGQARFEGQTDELHNRSLGQ